MIGFPKWLLFGVVAASVGGAVWVGLSYFLNVEVGYLAWGIGFLAGLGVRYAAGDDEGFLPGAAAVIAAVGVVAFSKYMAVSLAVNAALGGFDPGAMPDYANDRDAALVRYADTLIEAGHPEATAPDLRWPPGQSYETARLPEHYPPALMAYAGEQWDTMSDDLRATLIEGWSEPFDLDGVKQEAFVAQFGVFDLLWFGLAAFTAFGLGSNSVGGDD